MKKLIVLLCALYLVVAYGTAIAAPPSKTPTTTLNDIPPAWSKTLQCDTTACPRFELVMGNAAALDHETGLVWEISPTTNVYTWPLAMTYCASKEVGGRKGWHLPTIEQLASLVDTLAGGTPKLPTGHPFQDVQVSSYWSSTTATDSPEGARDVNLYDGNIEVNAKYVNFNVWCVRGGQSYDAH